MNFWDEKKTLYSFMYNWFAYPINNFSNSWNYLVSFKV